MLQNNMWVTESEPTVVVLNSALWDLAGWWLLEGEPKSRAVDAQDMEWWCNIGVLEALGWIKGMFPTSIVAFQVPPTMNYARGGRSPEILDKMAACVKARLAGTGVALIDFHQVVDNYLKTHSRQETFNDEVHLRKELTMDYMNLILTAAGGAPAGVR